MVLTVRVGLLLREHECESDADLGDGVWFGQKEDRGVDWGGGLNLGTKPY